MSAHDVLVAGGGPAGAATAALLARRGYDVALLDRATFPRDKACAEYCSPGVEIALRRIGAWDLVEQETPRRLRGMVLCIDGKPALPVRYESAGREVFAFSLRRSRFDDAVLRHARRCGVRVFEGLRVKNVVVGSSAVTADAILRNGDVGCFTARVIVGADGMHSAVARALGLRSTTHWPRRLGLIAHYEGVEGFDELGEMHVSRGVYCGLNPLPNGLLNVGLVVPLASGRSTQGGVRAVFERSIALLPSVAHSLRRGNRVKAIRGIGPMSRRVESAAGTGFVLVGDAAGFLDPFTGEGIYRALCGAEMAAESIDSALKSAGPSPAGSRKASSVPDLSTYSKVRRREFVAKERVTWIIQAALPFPPALQLLCGRVSSSSECRRLLGNVLGDAAPANSMLQPRVVAALLRPW